MRLRAYLDATGQSAQRFGGYAGIPERTVARIAAGGGCHAATAMAIVHATESKPAPDGGTVELYELVEPTRKSRKARR